MKKNNRGFTLVELLATIAILGLVISITVFTGIRLIKNGKEKTYQTTKNNIEKYASNYLVENGDRLFYLSDNKVKRYLFNIVVRILTDLCIDFSTIFCYHTVMRFVK